MNSTEQNSRQKLPLPLPLIISGFVIGLLIIGGLTFIILDQVLQDDSDQEAYTAVISGQNSTDEVRVISPARAITDFSLPNQYNHSTSIYDFSGRYVLMAFGYTHCPDVCPLTLNDFQQVYTQLGSESNEVQFLFITVDPQRDTPDQINRYFEMRGISGFLTGLAGDEITLNRISADYNLTFSKNDDEDANGFYTVDHTANIFLLDRETRLTRIFAFGTEPEIIAETIRELL